MDKRSALSRLRKDIRDAQNLLQGHETDVTDPLHQNALASALSSLLEQCREITNAATEKALPPMRSIHHFACSGGTLISRCLAAMPSIQILSEVDPLSTVGQRETFAPTSLIRLAQHGSRPPDQDVLVNIFLAGLRVLSDEARQSGFDMILRDHAHSQFCLGEDVLVRPTLRDMLEPHYRLRSVISVRHPLESYLSMQSLAWIRFIPGTLEEYARRYCAFLDRYKEVEIVRYEDFTTNPEAQAQQICDILDLQYNADFKDIFTVLNLSGNGGRSGGAIARRPRRAIPQDVKGALGNSPTYEVLCKRLGYDGNLEC